MTEAEWLECRGVAQLLLYCLDRVSVRKVRLFACAVCLRAWGLLTDVRSRESLRTAERYADGLATESELRSAQRAAVRARRGLALAFYRRERRQVYDEEPDGAPICAASAVVHAVSSEPFGMRADSFGEPSFGEPDLRYALLKDVVTARKIENPQVREGDEIRAQVAYLRDIVGNPFRTPSIHAACVDARNGLVRTMAREIYQRGSFQDLPILADALEDAGCDDAELLTHCRSQGEHVRGCWIVDAILGLK